jgi:hypothetical protein
VDIDRNLVIKWVKRLQDPKTKQAHSVLRDEQGGMCCLGHLCHVYARGLWRKTGPDSWSYLGDSAFLPDKLANLLGIKNDGRDLFGRDYTAPGRFSAHSLVNANDTQRWTLPEIAEAVIKHYGITPEELA